MPYQTTKYNKLLLIFITLAAWFALVFQLYLIIVNRKLSVPATIVQYFSYFTILSNLIVAISSATILVNSSSRQGNFFNKPHVLTAITLYITVVGLVYNAILRFLWTPEGMQKIVDELLHTLVPLLYILYWVLFVPKQSLQWKNALPWLVFPFIYSIYILCRGALTGLYPYPFMDVTVLGYQRVLINCAYLVAVFFLAALLFIGVGKLITGPGNKAGRI